MLEFFFFFFFAVVIFVKDGGADAWLPAQEASKATAPSAVPAEQQGASGQRDSWMVDPSGGDFFSSLGHRKGESEAERKRKEEEDEKKGMFDKVRKGSCTLCFYFLIPVLLSQNKSI